MTGTWVGLDEFARIFGRTKVWAIVNARDGHFSEFGILTLRAEKAYQGHCRWYFLIPEEFMLNQPIAVPLHRP
jgi:hypothetical protein